MKGRRLKERGNRRRRERVFTATRTRVNCIFYGQPWKPDIYRKIVPPCTGITVSLTHKFSSFQARNVIYSSKSIEAKTNAAPVPSISRAALKHDDAAGCTSEECGYFPAGEQRFLFSKTSRPAVWPTQAPVQQVPGFSPMVNRSGYKTGTSIWCLR